MTGHVSHVPLAGPDMIPFLPAYIPQDVDMTAVKAGVAADGVSAPPSLTPPLLQVVDQAGGDGINLKIVVLEHNPPNDTPLRDIATVVGSNYSNATVLVLSPSYVGTYSTQFPRVTLEAGEDISKTGNPVQSAHNFVGELDTPEFPWTLLTIALLIVVLAAAAGARIMRRISRSAKSSEGTATPVHDLSQAV